MSELNEPGETPAEPVREPDAAPSETAPERRRASALPALVVVALLVLLAGLAWTWQQGVVLQRRVIALESRVAAQPDVDPQRLAAVESTLDHVRKQVASLAARPMSAPVDLRPIEDRLTALEHRPAAQSVDLAPLEARIAALEQRPQAKPEDPALAARIETLAAAQKTTEQQAQAAEAAAHSSAERAARVQRLQQASADLAAGKPLGTIAGAPPALARFATTPPPTEAGLRLSFPQAAQAAASASEPSKSGLSFAQRMWQRAQSLVTVREGNRVIVGAPATATLAAARSRLDAGDLAGAVADLDALDPAAARAMAPWREQAQALLDARAALASAAAAG